MKRVLSSLFLTIFFAQATVAADFATEVMESTFKFFHTNSTATCFFVRREAPDTALYLISAAHTFERTKGDTAIVVLRQAMDDGSFKRLDHSIKIRRDGKPLWVRHEKQDVAVIRLSDPFPIAITALPESVLADAAQLKAAEVHICSPLFILTYPQRFEANGAGFPVARQGIFSSPPLLPVQNHPTFLADFTTFAGDSGGPVFIAGAEGHPLVVGIVLAQSHHVEHVKTEYDDRTIRHPLGLGTVLHAQYVRDTLEECAKQDASPVK